MVDLDGEPWFAAVDVYSLLFGRTTGINARVYLNQEEIRVFPKQSAPDSLCSLFKGTAKAIALVSESGLYKLITRSDKPTAKPFQDWVTQVVLPSIREHGGYIAGQERVATGEMSDAELMALEE